MNPEEITKILVFLHVFGAVRAYIEPQHGFFVAIQNPAVKRSSTVYVYAMHTRTLRTGDSIQISRDDSTRNVEGSRIRSEGATWGNYLKFSNRRRQKASRYGPYSAEYVADAGSFNSDAGSYGFVRPRSRILDAKGTYTVTIYPETSGSTVLSSAFDNSITLTRRARKYNLEWFKDNKRIRNTSNRLNLKTTDDAGTYSVRRQGRGDRRGASVQIRVIASTCPYDEYWNGVTCTTRTKTCLNGGVPKDAEDDCTCMPQFSIDSGNPCDAQVDSVGERGIYVLGISSGRHIQCHNLPGATFRCKGMLICYGDLYGCKCANGWRGDNCDKPCRKGTWGASCSVGCPDTDPDCNRFVGPNAALGMI